MPSSHRIQSGFLLLFCIFLFQSNILAQAKTKKRSSVESNSISITYGKRIDSLAIKGNFLSLEIGIVKKRKWPFYIELNYFSRQYEVKKTVPNHPNQIYYGYDEDTKALEIRFKLYRNLLNSNLFEISFKPFGLVGYQAFKHDPLVQNWYEMDTYNIKMGLGLEFMTGLKLTRNMSFITGFDYTILRTGYKDIYVNNPLLQDFQRHTKTFSFDFLDSYVIGKVGLMFLLN